MLSDETCRFLAFDYDAKEINPNDLKRDVSAIREACKEFSLHLALERSRSGKGIHFWLFFAENIPLSVLYKGFDKVHIIDAKNFDGGIMDNIDNAIVFLKRNLRVSYEIKTLQRKNILELPEDALREAVTNAVCHRDNFEKGARVMVEIFDDRVEITNPGSVPKGITRENFGSISIARNPVIASLLHRAGYIERMGTGINRMIAAMEGAGLKKPIFRTEGNFFKVIFERPREAAESGISERSNTLVRLGPRLGCEL